MWGLLEPVFRAGETSLHDPAISEREHLDPLRLVEFVNQVAASDTQFERDNHAAQQLANGHPYALARCSAKLYAARLSIKCQRWLCSIAGLPNSNICRQ